MSYDLVQGDCREVLRQFPDAFFDCVNTDPPYGLSKEPDAAEVLHHWLKGDDFKASGGGFMGKTWDSFVPGPATWREVYRVLKPGGYMTVFAGSRTQDLMGLAIRLAGFEIRDGLTWLYGSGFPKNHDVSKAIDEHLGQTDKRKVVGVKPGHENFVGRDSAVQSLRDSTLGQKGGFARPWMSDPDALAKYRMKTAAASPEAARWEGWGTALKPAFEPIILARRPPEGTVAENVLKHGVGGLNIGATRTNPGMPVPGGGSGRVGNFAGRVQSDAALNEGRQMPHSEGRYPANVILSHSPDCALVGSKVVKGKGHAPKNTGPGGMWGKKAGGGGRTGGDRQERYFTDEQVEAWECVEECPVRVLDVQSGPTGARSPVKGDEPSMPTRGTVYNRWERIPGAFHNDGLGGASRFFYCAKASRSEREAGLLGKVPCAKCGGIETTTHDVDGKPVKCIRNEHPTVKSLDVMRWLVKLAAPPGSLVLDPFLGSGTTGCAAAMEGVSFVGIELQEDYLAIARARIEHWKGQK